LQQTTRVALDDGVAGDDATMAGVCSEMRKVFAAFWPFLTLEGIEPTNSLAEQSRRPGVQMRSLGFGTDSAIGRRCFERIMIIVRTVRRHSHSLLNWLVEAFDAFRLDGVVPSLLPQRP
jgi:hypothetical protein